MYFHNSMGMMNNRVCSIDMTCSHGTEITKIPHIVIMPLVGIQEPTTKALIHIWIPSFRGPTKGVIFLFWFCAGLAAIC